ncbi:MAG: DUF4367 domain-containing protein [Lachnospiraceae bacterium]
MKRDRDLEKEKVESLYVTREMAEDKEMDEKIRQDLIHVADQAEKEFQEEEALGAPRMKPEEKQQLFDDIVGELKKKGIWEESPEDQLSAEDREALRLGRELLNNPKKKRSAVIHKIFKGVAGAAVVAVGVFVLSMSSEANRERMLSVWNSVVGNELRIDLSSEVKTEIESETTIEKMNTDVEEKLGIKPLKMMYIPENMKFDRWTLDDKSGVVDVYYLYNEAVVYINMYKQSNNSSRSQQFDGNIVDSIDIYSEGIKTNVWEIQNPDGNSYICEFVYDNVPITLFLVACPR